MVAGTPSQAACGVPSQSSGPSKKRALPPCYSDGIASAPRNFQGDGVPAPSGSHHGTPKRRKTEDKDVEKRLRRFRPHPPQSFHEIYQRAISQRFFVLDRSRCGTEECPEEIVELTGSTGNIYHVHIARQPTCTCPHAVKGNQCKHILYVMSRVLRVRQELVYQLALLSSELVEIFRKAPAIKSAEDRVSEDKNRKPVEGDCPICFMELEATEPIVYCQAQCGQNIHKECFGMWAATKRKTGHAQVPCPMCRTPWQGSVDGAKKIKNTGIVGVEGYVNVADQLGISRVRDMSSYYSWRRHY